MSVWTCRVVKDRESAGIIVTCRDNWGWSMTFKPQPQKTPNGIVYVADKVTHEIPANLKIDAIDDGAA